MNRTKNDTEWNYALRQTNPASGVAGDQRGRFSGAWGRCAFVVVFCCFGRPRLSAIEPTPGARLRTTHDRGESSCFPSLAPRLSTNTPICRGARN